MSITQRKSDLQWTFTVVCSTRLFPDHLRRRHSTNRVMAYIELPFLSDLDHLFCHTMDFCLHTSIKHLGKVLRAYKYTHTVYTYLYIFHTHSLLFRIIRGLFSLQVGGGRLERHNLLN